ncbi:flagellar export chaperone FlgN [Thalassomonas viridans]|uniref:Flagellar export chaperone FlgN n=1 Tax=Thalassomonas viridans TaxID=137584 RepID=A0AAE9Z2Q8_9GAMM|nr:flagellar export chaperone FlgN [Thalassomonas viridans]WDE05167.1 flagellar export chaperone FlgN [Thalassomonas viridans]
MNNVQQGLRGLVNGIKQDIIYYTRFQALLKEQQVAMQRHDSEKLLQVNQRHEKLYQVILAQAKKRKAILLKLGVSADNEGIEKVFNSLNHVSKGRVYELWQQLQQLTLDCQQQNDINGRLLAAQHELLNKLLHPQESGEYAPAMP